MSSILFNVVVNMHKGTSWLWVAEREDTEDEADPVPMCQNIKN